MLNYKCLLLTMRTPIITLKLEEQSEGQWPAAASVTGTTPWVEEVVKVKEKEKGNYLGNTRWGQLLVLFLVPPGGHSGIAGS